MKATRTKTFRAIVGFALIALLCASGAFAVEVKKDALAPDIDVYAPAGANKTPLVFLAHNGGAKKEDWKDYASDLAATGYTVASIGWTDFGKSDDFASAFKTVIAAYGDRVDLGKIAFIGGCHGAVKLTWMMAQDENVRKIKAFVFLSPSEDIKLPAAHAPVLGFYATKDHLGDYYVKKTKEVVTGQISKPAKAVEVASSAHGHELVNDDEGKTLVRKEIADWLKAYL
jgi:dienelactone hydrolase